MLRKKSEQGYTRLSERTEEEIQSEGILSMPIQQDPTRGHG